MSENTTDKKRFLGLSGVKLILDNLKEKYSPLVHTHDDLYYTETEVDELLLDLKDGNTVVAKADEATHATNADKATNAEHSDEATHAINADNAINAENATKATQDASGNVITDTYETKTDANAKLQEAKEYADTAATTVKNDLLNGAGEAYDTLKELGTLIDENLDAIEALEIVATNKADKEHAHTVSEITDYVEPVQSDWNESDETALSFIKNRPFYEFTEEKVISSTTTYQCTYQALHYGSNIKNYQSDLIAGNTYKVIYNGDEYILKAKLTIDDTRPYLGNLKYCYNLFDSSYDSSDTGEPFLIVNQYDTDRAEPFMLFRVPYGTENVELSITEISEVTHKLDEKFIPDTIARTDHTHSWNDLEDKPFYDTRYTEEIDNSFNFTFDGNLEGREYIEIAPETMYTVKLSDTPLTKEQLICCSKTEVSPSGTTTSVVGSIIDEGSFIYDEGAMIFSVFEVSNIMEQNWDVGLYAIYRKGEGVYTSSISKTDIQIVEHGELKQLDEKYIPDTIAREGHVHSYNDLTDRTHYEEEKFGYLFEFDSDEGNTPPSSHNGSCTMAQDSGYRFIEGETYTITTVDKYGVEISGDVICVKTNAKLSLQTNLINSQNETLYMHFYQLEDESSTTIYGEHDSWINSGGRSMLKLYGYLGYELKQLDEKYIPDSIARDNTFVITLINNGDGTYSYDKTFEELLMAHVTDKKDLRLDSSCIGMPYPNFLPFTGNFGGGVQFSACVDDNSTNPANPIPLMVGVTLCPGQYAETFQKDLFGTSVGLLDTTDKTIIGAINEVNEKVDNALVDAGGDSVFIVTVTENEDGSYSADKTFAEIVEAHENGKIIVLYDIYSWSLLTNLTDNELFFGSCIATRSDEVEDIASFFSYVIDKDNVIHFNNTNTAQILDDYFESMCSNLTTTDKTIVGAINELNAKHTDGTYTQEIVNEVLNALPTWTGGSY